MEMSGIAFGVTDWAQVERTEHKGESRHGVLANAKLRGRPRSDGGVFRWVSRQPLVQQGPRAAMPRRPTPY